MNNLDPRIRRLAITYLALAVLAVVLVQFFPGAGVRPQVDQAPHPYRLAMGAVVLSLAIALGVLSAWSGEALGGWHLGLAELVIGGIVTGALLAFAPSILYANDQYPVTFGWILLGAPAGFLSWLACSLALRARGTVDHAG